ncbi:MAG TPA: TetR family transcriptional regulator [Vicinamibacterales bacterium]|jgi:AcrR family transcriptional regulator
MTLKHTEPSPGTRERILDTAERLFAVHGFAGTSVREITDAAEANLGAVNYYFRSKENLYTEVFMRRAALLRGPVEAAGREAAGLARTSPERALRTLGRAFMVPHEDHGASQYLIGLFAREAVEACLPPGLLVREFLVPIIETTTGVLRRAWPNLPETKARACAHSFFAQLMHIVKGAGHAATPVDDQFEHAVRFTVAAVRHMAGDQSGPSRRNS